jgi:hypothetical protein
MSTAPPVWAFSALRHKPELSALKLFGLSLSGNRGEEEESLHGEEGTQKCVISFRNVDIRLSPKLDIRI